MSRGIEAAATGMIGIMNWNDVLANNLANINTPGFKQTLVSFKNSQNLDVNKVDAKDGYTNVKLGNLSAGSTLDSTALDFRQGSLKMTGNSTDLAISGEGFFVVRTPNGDAYTRNGSFIRKNDGTLTTVEGYPVIGEKGKPIILKPSNNDNKKDQDFKISEVKVNKDGSVLVGDAPVDKISIVDFKDKQSLQAIGSSLYKSATNEGPSKAKSFEVNQGSLEMANSNAVETMVNSITGMRTYDNLAKFIESDKKIESRTVNDLGRLKR